MGAIIKIIPIVLIFFTGENMDLSRVQRIVTDMGWKAQSNGNQAAPQNRDHSGPNLLQAPDKLFSTLGKIRLSDIGAMGSLSFSDNNPPGKLINENTRVLHIGDSHTAGIYGANMDKMMRNTGAKVLTIGSSGSSPASWLNGYVTHSGMYYNENGKNQVPKNWQIITPETAAKLKSGEMKEWQIPTRTPNLTDMIDKFKPNVIIFSLGANMLDYARKVVVLKEKAKTETDPGKLNKIASDIKSLEEGIYKQTRNVCEVAKESGAKIVWVGPPDGRPDKKPTEVQNELYQEIENIVSQYAAFVDSRPYTDYPAGAAGDGVHYHKGKEAETAREWAKSIFNEIQK